MNADTKWALKILGYTCAKWFILMWTIVLTGLAVWHCTPVDRLCR